MNRKLFSIHDSFTIDSIPGWICPTCNMGVLHFDERTFCKDETKESKEYAKHDDWAPEYIGYRFAALLKCTNPSCKDIVSVCGYGYYDYIQGYDSFKKEAVDLSEDVFKPKFFSPPLNIIEIPLKTPKDIRLKILNAFSLFWVDKNSCANSLRIVLEMILTALKIKRYDPRRRPLSLNLRINLLQSKYEDIKDRLTAIKWIGNIGSHEESLNKESLLDVFELFEYVLNFLYENPDKKTKKLAKIINKKKGRHN